MTLSVLLLAAPSPQARADEVFDPAKNVATTSSNAQELKDAEKAIKKAARRGERAISAARSRAGKPYSYGAAGPNAFDCSGLTQWVYRRVGERLPRTSGAQAAATRRVSQPRRGDLVFFTSGGRVYHVGIYAGNRMIWHASRPGVPVRKDRIWSSSVFYGRVR